MGEVLTELFSGSQQEEDLPSPDSGARGPVWGKVRPEQILSRLATRVGLSPTSLLELCSVS